jgi:type I restriction enzyme S subunit
MVYKSIPVGWTEISLTDDLLFIKTGVNEYEGEKEYFSTGSIQDGSISSEGRYSYSNRPSRANRIAQKGDIFQARMKNTNKALLIDKSLNSKLFSTGFFQIRPDPKSINNKYIFYYLSSLTFHEVKDKFCTGSTQESLSDKNAKNILIPIPPIHEQHRIVEKIEEFFSEIDKGIEYLQTTKEQLEVYRQAILKAAFEGKLTQGWRNSRASNQSKNELINRIKKIQKEQYSTIQINSVSKKKLTTSRKQNFKYLSENYASFLDNIPSNWILMDVESLLTIFDKGMTTGPFGTVLSKKDHRKDGRPVLGIENICNGNFVKGNKIFVDEEFAERLDAYSVKADDIIISRSGTVGEICCVPVGWENSLISSNLIKLSLNTRIINPKYFVFLFQSKVIVYDQVLELCKGSTRVFLNQKILKSIVYPIPPIEEQEQIVQELESRISVCDHMEETIKKGLVQAESLKQSILKKAFEGRLVPQDPDDEPAAVLLEQIREEKRKQEEA